MKFSLSLLPPGTPECDLTPVYLPTFPPTTVASAHLSVILPQPFLCSTLHWHRDSHTIRHRNPGHVLIISELSPHHGGPHQIENES